MIINSGIWGLCPVAMRNNTGLTRALVVVMELLTVPLEGQEIMSEIPNAVTS